MQNIVSGEEFVNCKDMFGIRGEVLSFNEAMADGRPKGKIFSQEFIEERLKTHKVSAEEYDKTVLGNIKKIDLGGELSLYFGFDMFCQINLLTLLAYLEQKNYNKNVTVYICDEIKHTVADRLSVFPKGFNAFYEKIVVSREKIITNFSYLDNAENLYFNYANRSTAVLGELLKDCGETEEYGIIRYLILNDTVYGLGDRQWADWLKRLINEQT